MAISIIYPIEVGDNGNVVTANSTSVVMRTGIGMTSYADQSSTEAIKQNFKMLLLTRKGEYVMDLNYGIGLPDYLFMQEQEIDTDALEGEIRNQVSTYLPYMTISKIEIKIDEINPVMLIRVEFYYNGILIPEIFELEVN
jgi:phage baseplate assembly protein W